MTKLDCGCEIGGGMVTAGGDLRNAEIVWCTLHAQAAETLRQRDAMLREREEVEQILGRALGYPEMYEAIIDGQQAIVGPEWPGARPIGKVCVGDHVLASLAVEAADAVRQRGRLLEALRPFAAMAKTLEDEPPQRYVAFGFMAGDIREAAAAIADVEGT